MIVTVSSTGSLSRGRYWQCVFNTSGSGKIYVICDMSSVMAFQEVGESRVFSTLALLEFCN